MINDGRTDTPKLDFSSEHGVRWSCVLVVSVYVLIRMHHEFGYGYINFHKPAYPASFGPKKRS